MKQLEATMCPVFYKDLNKVPKYLQWLRTKAQLLHTAN